MLMSGKVHTDDYDVYKTLGLLSMFGTRQINVLSTMKTQQEITSHFTGLLSLRGMKSEMLNTIEVQRIFTKLCN